MPTTLQEIKTIQQQMISVLLNPTSMARLQELHAEWILVLTALSAQPLPPPELQAIHQSRASLLGLQQRQLRLAGHALLTESARQQYIELLGRAVQLL